MVEHGSSRNNLHPISALPVPLLIYVRRFRNCVSYKKQASHSSTEEMSEEYDGLTALPSASVLEQAYFLVPKKTKAVLRTYVFSEMCDSWYFVANAKN